MKRKGTLLCLILLLTMLVTSFSYAGSFELTGSFPEEGSSNTTLMNVAVKLYFSESVSAEATQTANAGCFSMKAADGKSIPLIPTYDAEKYPNEVWLIVNDTLESDTAYSVEIDGSMVSDAGNTLGQAAKVDFQSRNTQTDSNVNMLMMLVMVGVILVVGFFETKRNVKKEMERRNKVDTVNPYKESKRTGKSVEEIVAKSEKEKARVAKKYAAYQARVEKKAEAEEEGWVGRDVKRVQRRASVKKTGITLSPAVLERSRELARVARALDEAEDKYTAKENARKNKNKKKK